MTTLREAVERGSLDIRYYLTDPDDILSTPCEALTDEEFGAPAEKMGSMLFELMKKGHNGVGLAAPQGGVLKRMFVMLYRDEKDNEHPVVVCNPSLTYFGECNVLGQEGCLSVPDVYNQVRRYARIEMLFRRPSGEYASLYLTDFNARVAQHEFDHLNGEMFFDKLASRQMRKATLRDWTKEGKRYGVNFNG